MKIRTFVHRETKRFYVVTSEVDIKDTHTRKWVKGYMYAPVLNALEQRPLLMLVRPQNDFHERFVELPYIEHKDLDRGLGGASNGHWSSNWNE